MTIGSQLHFLIFGLTELKSIKYKTLNVLLLIINVCTVHLMKSFQGHKLNTFQNTEKDDYQCEEENDIVCFITSTCGR